MTATDNEFYARIFNSCTWTYLDLKRVIEIGRGVAFGIGVSTSKELAVNASGFVGAHYEFMGNYHYSDLIRIDDWDGMFVPPFPPRMYDQMRARWYKRVDFEYSKPEDRAAESADLRSFNKDYPVRDVLTGDLWCVFCSRAPVTVMDCDDDSGHEAYLREYQPLGNVMVENRLYDSFDPSEIDALLTVANGFPFRTYVNVNASSDIYYMRSGILHDAVEEGKRPSEVLESAYGGSLAAAFLYALGTIDYDRGTFSRTSSLAPVLSGCPVSLPGSAYIPTHIEDKMAVVRAWADSFRCLRDRVKSVKSDPEGEGVPCGFFQLPNDYLSMSQGNWMRDWRLSRQKVAMDPVFLSALGRNKPFVLSDYVREIDVTRGAGAGTWSRAAPS